MLTASFGNKEPSAVEPVMAFDWPEGLSSAEARARQLPNGSGDLSLKLDLRRKTSTARSVFTVFNLNLVGLAVIQLLLGSISGAVTTSALLALTTTVRVAQQLLANRRMERFRAFQQADYSVMRGGRLTTLPSDQIVVGDVLVAGPGDQIIADGSLLGPGPIELYCSFLSADQQYIRLNPGEKIGAGSVVLNGRAVYRAQVAGTNQPAEFKSASNHTAERSPTRLERLIATVLRVLLVVVLVYVVLLFSSYFHIDLGEHGDTLVQAAPVIFSIIPTGMYLMIIVTYAAGRVELAREGGLVTNARAVETLAETSVVCFTEVGSLLGPSVSFTLCGDGSVPYASGSRTRQALGDLARSLTARTAVMRILEEAYEGSARVVREEGGDLSSLGWIAVTYGDKDAPGNYVLGVKSAIGANLTRPLVESKSDAEGSPLVLAHRTDTAPLLDSDGVPALPDQLEPLAVVAFSEDPSADAGSLVRAFRDEGVAVKVFAKGGTKMILGLLRAGGMTEDEIDAIISRGMQTREMLEATPSDLWGEVARDHFLFNDLTPIQVGELVRLMREEGSVVTVVGDGTSDLPALGQASLAVAQPGSTQATLSIADVVLRENNQEALLNLMRRGRAVVGGLIDVMKLNLTMVVCTALLILYIRTLTVGFPYLSGQGSVISLLTATIPSIYLGLFTSLRETRGYSPNYARTLVRFVAPAGVLLSLISLAVYELEILATRNVTTAQMAVTYTLLYAGLSLNLVIRPERRFNLLILALAFAGVMIPAVPILRNQFGFNWMEPIQYLVVAIAVLAWLTSTFAAWNLIKRRSVRAGGPLLDPNGKR